MFKFDVAIGKRVSCLQTQYAIESYSWSGSTIPHILNFGIGWCPVDTFRLLSLYCLGSIISPGWIECWMHPKRGQDLIWSVGSSSPSGFKLSLYQVMLLTEVFQHIVIYVVKYIDSRAASLLNLVCHLENQSLMSSRT